MPHVSVKCFPGRTEEQKQALAKKITEDVKEIIDGHSIIQLSDEEQRALERALDGE